MTLKISKNERSIGPELYYDMLAISYAVPPPVSSHDLRQVIREYVMHTVWIMTLLMK